MDYISQKQVGKTSLTNPDAAFIELAKPLYPVMQAITIEPLYEGIILPSYATDGDSGMDVYAPHDVLIKPGETVLIKLGFLLGIPMHPFHDWGYRWEAQARPRSGVALKTDLSIPNSPGTIDNFYRNEVGVLIRNTYDKERALSIFGDRTNLYEKTTLTLRSLAGKVLAAEDPHPVGTYLIQKGERFAQLVFNQVIRPLEVVQGKVSKEIDRGGGFGHSGT